ncbi:50S ribosomal protein L33 [Thalictrum thalictroides]|uniref:Large ribosomal subunit protein bL33c n=1 Tax=Thalictrum thalictroides TaxID=46969 RepID=A0A7J6W1F9_THATH|nr:50S ribosomal protein L33 [Thalictrum thalictroides]
MNESSLWAVISVPQSLSDLAHSHRLIDGEGKRWFDIRKLVSAAGTGFFYVKRKNPRKMTEKLEFRKYDPSVNPHVPFTESKMK